VTDRLPMTKEEFRDIQLQINKDQRRRYWVSFITGALFLAGGLYWLVHHVEYQPPEFWEYILAGLFGGAIFASDR